MRQRLAHLLDASDMALLARLVIWSVALLAAVTVLAAGVRIFRLVAGV